MQKQRGIFLGMLKKGGIFLGIRYEPLSDPPPVIKICEWGPWVLIPIIFGSLDFQLGNPNR